MSNFMTLFKLNKKLTNISLQLVNLLRVKKNIKYKSILKRNIELKKFKKTKRCVICGLGPSLKQIDLTQITDDTIVVNDFYKFGKDIDFEPTYYIATDGAFSRNNNINRIENAINRYNDTKFIFGTEIYETLKEKRRFSENMYVTHGRKGLFSENSRIDFTKNSSVTLNIIPQAIILAIYLGYKEIALVGCDFNSFASQKSVHCYKETNESRRISMSFELYCYSIVADIHNEIEKYAKKKDIKIINATEGSLIDAYERWEYLNDVDYIPKKKI